MSSYLPTYFFLAEPGTIGEDAEHWSDAADQLTAALEEPSKTLVCSFVSNNHFHVQHLLTVARDSGLAGLEFLNKSLAVLQGKELLAALRDLSSVIPSLLVTLGLGPNAFSSPRLGIIDGTFVPFDSLDCNDTPEDYMLFVKALMYLLTVAIVDGKCLVYLKTE